MKIEQGSCKVVCVGFDEEGNCEPQHWIMVEDREHVLSTVFTDSNYDGYDTGDAYPR